jgi:hypothetical protein
MIDPEVIAQEVLGPHGRLLCHSKSEYANRNPGDTVFFNGCVFDSRSSAIWYGDINITLDSAKLQTLADKLEQTVFVTREHPWQWRSDEGRKLYDDLVAHMSDRSVIAFRRLHSVHANF